MFKEERHVKKKMVRMIDRVFRCRVFTRPGTKGNFQIFPKVRLRGDGSIKYYNVGYGFHLSLSIKDTRQPK